MFAGDWFCSPKCQDIHHALRARVALGLVDLNDDYQWQLLHGKDQTTYTTWQLKGCQEILEESFDPIIDQISKQNLVRGMVYSEQQGEWDHTGMFAAILKYKVCSVPSYQMGTIFAHPLWITWSSVCHIRIYWEPMVQRKVNLLCCGSADWQNSIQY